ncbi:cation-transporting P-type ATPase B domain protein [Mycobacterium ulcerans str. Harvey]|uniref:Cation-transporting P-type ATPase B domain protein n=1 Tax=Mycobacterium ulcerans str. Harvey TaxID=1299332 RepID=A0ABN0RAU7_MYCUL|nr:cation-transporting P-type ATPase B domain protein [Mycobacterium ulcerans str. Harvey]
MMVASGRGRSWDFHQGLSGAGNHSRYRRRGIRQDGHADGGKLTVNTVTTTGGGCARKFWLLHPRSSGF